MDRLLFELVINSCRRGNLFFKPHLIELMVHKRNKSEQVIFVGYDSCEHETLTDFVCK